MKGGVGIGGYGPKNLDWVINYRGGVAADVVEFSWIKQTNRQQPHRLLINNAPATHQRR